jgi:CRP-like cAMP-binding protein
MVSSSARLPKSSSRPKTTTQAPVRARVAELLLEQTQRFGVPQEAGWCALDTELRHDDFAAMVPATRVSVTAAIASLRAAGFLVGTRGHYRLHLDGLAQVAIGLPE